MYGRVKNKLFTRLSVFGVLVLFNLILSAMMMVGIPVIVVQILGMSDTVLGITQGAIGAGWTYGRNYRGRCSAKAPSEKRICDYNNMLACSVFSDKPYLVMIGAAILAMAVSLYSKKVFAILEKESAVK